MVEEGELKLGRQLAALALGITLALGATGDVGAAVGAEVSRDDVQRMVVEEAVRAGLSPELALAVAKVESGFNPAAHSSAGARGVMQIMPATAKGEFGVGAELLWMPALNIRLGVAFLKGLLNVYGREEFALSHYNGGSRVGPPPFRVIPETRDYVDLVLAWKRRYVEQGGARTILANLGTITPRQLPSYRSNDVRPPVRRMTPVARNLPSPGRWIANNDWDGGPSRRWDNSDRW